MDATGVPPDEGSSSPDLSSPPQSPEAPSGDNGGPHNGVPASSTTSIHGGALSLHNASPSTTNATPPPAASKPAPKRQRKKKEPPPTDTVAIEEKPKRTRKPKDPNAPPPPPRKRKKAEPPPPPVEVVEEKPAAPSKGASKPQHHAQPQPAQQAQQPASRPAPAEAASTSTRQSKINDLINQATVPETHSPAPQQQQQQQLQQQPQQQPQQQQPQSQSQHATPTLAQTPRPQSLANPDVVRNQAMASIAAPSTPRPASSGQVFDPVRSATAEPRPSHNASNGPPLSPPAKVVNRASASPSINSLIDPMPVERPVTTSNLTQTARYQPPPVAPTSAPVSPAMRIRSTASVINASSSQQSSLATPGTFPVAMDIDSEKEAPKKAAVPMKKSDSAGASNTSAAPTPPIKPIKPKDVPPPLPGTGSGLLSGTPLGPTLSSGNAAGQGTNIWLTFPLKGQNNVTINFAREVEKKYGFAALHPRIAAQKERRRQIALAGATLEKASGANSADEMSLDLSEPESNADMGGVDDEGSAAGGAKKKRRKRVDEYDKDDDFIDDTELAWEQQALMAKDGFFVYSGPLITEGDKPPIERADGTVRRGRGRGRGGTSRTGNASGDASSRGNRGGGRGSRGGTTVRKPRVTKADRAMMEQEKHEREKMAATLAAKQGQVFSGNATPV